VLVSLDRYGTTLVMLASTLGTAYILKEKDIELVQFLSIAVVSASLFLYNLDKIFPPTQAELAAQSVAAKEELSEPKVADKV